MQAVWAVISTAVAVSLVIGITNGPLAGISLLLGFTGVLSLVVIFVPTRPQLTVSLRGGDNATNGSGEIGLIIGAGRTVRPFDIEQIVEEQAQVAYATMPRKPTPKLPPGSPMASIFEQPVSFGGISGITEASDERLEEFIAEVKEYRQQLEDWLEELAAARQDQLRDFSCLARVSEGGQAPADFSRIRLHFPRQFEEPEPAPRVPEPPNRPEFRSLGLGPVIGPVAATLYRQPPVVLPHPAAFQKEASYSQEGGLTVIAMSVGHVNQSDHRDTEEFYLRAPDPGVHEVEWRVSATGLNSPTKGKINIEVREPDAGEPITTLEQALNERKRFSLS
jgi:hypothetical protein